VGGGRGCSATITENTLQLSVRFSRDAADAASAVAICWPGPAIYALFTSPQSSIAHTWHN